MTPPQKPILVVGSINTDLVVTTANLPSAGSTVAGRSFAAFQGGKGANQAVAAARMGATVHMAGKVGSDVYGAASILSLQHHGVDCEHVDVTDGPSGVAVITVSADGQNTIVVVPGANAQVTPAFVDSKRHLIRSACLVLAQLEIPMESVLRLATICREEGIGFMLDPAPAKALPDGLLQACTWFTPNETEAHFYTGSGGGSKTVAALLQSQGAQNIVLKRGAKGAYFFTGDREFEIPAIAVQAVDTTAAGDTYNGAFAAAMAAHRDVAFCARFAGAAAALSVTRQGAQASVPSLSEVMALLQNAD